MRIFLGSLVIVFAIFTLLVPDADARRLGGGGNLGKQRQSYSRQEAAPAAAPAQPSANPARQQARPNSWLGPLAGLAIGGLLGSMLFGQAFQGLQLFDILVLAGIAAAAYYFLRGARRTPTTRAAPSYAGPTTNPSETANFQIPEIGSALEPPARVPAAVPPAWFDEPRFIKAAKTHFIRLQTAWDRNDLNDIREYTTPQLFAELSLERQACVGPQYTEVVDLHADVLDVVTEGDYVIASVRYSGTIREEEHGPALPFNEIWHVQRALNDDRADWYVAGIQQA
jgi:predicted lipid-binding transport protein (Tim44 family)